MNVTDASGVIDFDANVNQSSNTTELIEICNQINTNATDNSISTEKSVSNYQNEAPTRSAFDVLKNSGKSLNSKEILSPNRAVAKKRKVKPNNENPPSKISKNLDKTISEHLNNSVVDNTNCTNSPSVTNTSNQNSLLISDKVRVRDLEMKLERKVQKVEELEEFQKKAQETLKNVLIENSKFERESKKLKMNNNKLELGYYDNVRHGIHYEQRFIAGRKFEKLDKKRKQIEEQQKENERKRKELNKCKPTSDKGKAPKIRLMPELDSKEFGLQLEIIEINRLNLNKDEKDLDLKLEYLTRARNSHLREMRRIDNEEASRFKNFSVMNDRYLLLSLLGKGGFSEVYKAFDLDQLMFVACKIHQLNSNWSREKKESYMKHGYREIKIQKSLDHKRIVRLFDVFNHDEDTFVMVLEYCEGNDLDFYLKQNKCMPERDAKSVISQVVSAVHYLNTRQRRIIHYDLKPANILLCNNGEIKITDFGLSKILMDDNNNDQDEIELTSQGAGTYWYLPPECFVTDEGATKIDTTLDVWSIGVIFYQCLYGIKPFGNDESQTDILNNNTILQARKINFPANPKVSEAAKEFIKKCFTYTRQERPDIFNLHADDYLKPKSQQK